MQVSKDRVVSFHYIMRNHAGEELENNSKRIPVTYLHGGLSVEQSLQDQMCGLTVGEVKEVFLENGHNDKAHYNFSITIEDIRLATDEELALGMVIDTGTTCGPGCDC